MSILHHPEWAMIRQHLRLEAYDRDTNAKGEVRKRIEVKPCDHATMVWLTAVETDCPRCGAWYQPMRERKGEASCYYAVACQESGCCKGLAASAEQKAIIADLQGNPVYAPMPLFEDE